MVFKNPFMSKQRTRPVGAGPSYDPDAHRETLRRYDRTMAQVAEDTHRINDRILEEKRLKAQQRESRAKLGLQDRQLEMERAIADGQYKLDGRKQLLAEKSTDANLRLSAQQLADARQIENRELDYKEALPNQAEIADQRYRHEAATYMDKEMSTVFGELRKMDLDPEGQKKLGELQGAYRALQSQRAKMKPEQYADLMGMIMDEVQNSGLDSYQNRIQSPEEMYNQRSHQLKDGRIVLFDDKGNPKVVDPPKDDKKAGLTEISDASIMSPDERMKRLMIGTSEDDVKAREKMADRAIEQIRLRKGADENGVEYDPSPQEIAQEIQAIFDRDYQMQRTGLFGPPKPDIPNMEMLGSQGGVNHEAEAAALRELGIQPAQPVERRIPDPSRRHYPISDPDSPVNVQALSPTQQGMAEKAMPTVYDEDDFNEVSPGATFIDGETGAIRRKPAKAPDPMDSPSPSSIPMLPREKQLEVASKILAQIVGGKPSDIRADPKAVRDTIQKGFENYRNLTEEQQKQLRELLRVIP